MVEQFRKAGYEPAASTLYTYAAFQAGAQVADEAGTTAPDGAVEVLHDDKFATVVGTIDCDAKGDVAGIDAFGRFVWTEGRYALLEEGGRLSD